MEDSQAETSSDELEVTEMIWIDSGGWINLKSVVVMR